MTEDHQQLVHRSIEQLHGPEEITYAEDELVVVCLVRDGRPYLKSFVEHYFSLGVKHIVFLDNGSIDGTVSAAQSYDNETSSAPPSSFSPAGSAVLTFVASPSLGGT